MSAPRLQVVFAVLAMSLALGLANFLAFIYFYNAMTADLVTEYWRSIHGGQMFREVLPVYLGLSLLGTSTAVVTALRFRHANGDKR